MGENIETEPVVHMRRRNAIDLSGKDHSALSSEFFDGLWRVLMADTRRSLYRFHLRLTRFGFEKVA